MISQIQADGGLVRHYAPPWVTSESRWECRAISPYTTTNDVKSCLFTTTQVATPVSARGSYIGQATRRAGSLSRMEMMLSWQEAHGRSMDGEGEPGGKGLELFCENL